MILDPTETRATIAVESVKRSLEKFWANDLHITLIQRGPECFEAYGDSEFPCIGRTAGEAAQKLFDLCSKQTSGEGAEK